MRAEAAAQPARRLRAKPTVSYGTQASTSNPQVSERFAENPWPSPSESSGRRLACCRISDSAALAADIAFSSRHRHLSFPTELVYALYPRLPEFVNLDYEGERSVSADRF